ncbi:cation:proton antiporter, partial [Pseudoalteromonas sp. SIMBA_148]
AVTTVVADTAEDWLGRINFNSLVMDGVLSFLLFAGALHVDLSRLKAYRRSIGLLATLGVLISTLVIGSAAWWLFQWAGIEVPYLYCLVFG